MESSGRSWIEGRRAAGLRGQGRGSQGRIRGANTSPAIAAVKSRTRFLAGKGFLSREEKLVILTVSVCLLGGGLFQLAGSLFELPRALVPPEIPAQKTALVEGYTPEDQARTRTRQSAAAAERGAGNDADRLHAGSSGKESGEWSDAERDRIGSSSLRGMPSCAERIPGKLDLNSATQAELEGLPGIGPVLAVKIVERRAEMGGFDVVEDVLSVKGIGEKTLSRFREWVYVSPPR